MDNHKQKLDKSNIVSKHNVLNALRPNDMTLQELRFFSIYLSKINPLDESTRVVKFPLSDFKAIIELKSHLKTLDVQTITRGLLQKIVEIPNEHADEGGYISFQLFKECELTKDMYGAWYVSIDAHDRALPFMFQLKGHYFKYELWNTLRLKSRNQLRMYEVLKQYEKIGYRILSVPDLKGWLGIGENEYSRFGNFNTKVLAVCQQALAKYTDISFTYEPYGKKGSGGKILQLKFNITKNKGYVDPLGLDKFIELKTKHETDDESIDDVTPEYRERINLFLDACLNSFSWDEMREINSLLSERMPQIFADELKCYNYLHRKFLEMVRYNKRPGGIKHKFNYFRMMLGSD